MKEIEFDLGRESLFVMSDGQEINADAGSKEDRDVYKRQLEGAVTTIKLTGAFIIRKNVDGMHLDVIVSYGRKPFDRCV